jgi:hypothetical protein
MREVRLDGLRGYEERLRDLAVRLPLCRHLRDAALARGERVDSATNEAPGTGARRAELGVCALDQRDRAAAMGELEPFLEVGPS